MRNVIARNRRMRVILRCHVDGLLLEAFLPPGPLQLIVVDGDEAFAMEAVEAMFYEVIAATKEELLGLERAGYRLLKIARDFQSLEIGLGNSCSDGQGENTRGSWAE